MQDNDTVKNKNEQGVSSDISVEVLQQIEEDKQIAQSIQDQLYDDELSGVNVKCR